MEAALTMPVGNILVGDSGSDIKHDDATLAVDVVAISQTSKLFLTGCIPHIELNRSEVLDFVSLGGASPLSWCKRTVVKPRG